ncbi:RHS repeat-associated core domain-containing protein [Flavobacterium kingsejongi]|uniref:RHS repeat-associated core domain-containing protein n=1 Tax=Flavobacterium kingsejongi TaxID=1678728 RepID=UPI0021D3B250|nr:RHS repeat-associated core domain-containing protein [Flavobacterium kingsejongi]
MGNVRVPYTKDPLSGLPKIVEESNYYPFGMKHANYNDYAPPAPGVANKGYQYKYNGQEYQQEFDLDQYSMPFRQYDPAIGRWTSIDPIVQFSLSPYNGFGNNPVLWSDPTGAYAEYNWKAHDNGYMGLTNIGGTNYDYEGNEDNKAVFSLKTTAKLYFEGKDVSTLTENDKQNIFKTNATETIGVLLWEFATGTGLENRSFNYGEHPFATQFMDGRMQIPVILITPFRFKVST